MTFFIPTEVQEWNAKLLPYFKLTRSVTWISKQKSNQILLRLWTAMNPNNNIVKFWLWSFFCFHLFSHIMWQDARFWSKFKYMAFLGLGWDTWHCSPNSFTGFIFQVWLSNDSGLLQLKKNQGWKCWIRLCMVGRAEHFPVFKTEILTATCIPVYVCSVDDMVLFSSNGKYCK